MSKVEITLEQTDENMYCITVGKASVHVQTDNGLSHMADAFETFADLLREMDGD